MEAQIGVSLDRAKEILGITEILSREEMMSNVVSAKILRKKVDDGAYGTKRYSFYIAYRGENKWVSAFADPKKMAQEVIDLLRELGEGDRAEFTLVENTGKDGKVYLNIGGLVRETQLKEDEPEPVQPDGRKQKAVEPEGVRVRSMALAYAKDIEIAYINKHSNEEQYGVDVVINNAKRFEQYINTGE